MHDIQVTYCSYVFLICVVDMALPNRVKRRSIQEGKGFRRAIPIWLT